MVDLGAGSGAISIAIASEATLKSLKVSVIAVEKSALAAEWLNKNIAKYDLPIRVVVEDVQTALDGVKADLVVANPLIFQMMSSCQMRLRILNQKLHYVVEK